MVAASIFLGRLLFVARKRRNELRLDIERISRDIFGECASSPSVQVGHSYGFPRFQLTFPSNELLEQAKSAGLTQSFLNNVQNRCIDSGSKRNPFEASRATWFTSKEQLEAIANKRDGIAND